MAVYPPPPPLPFRALSLSIQANGTMHCESAGHHRHHQGTAQGVNIAVCLNANAFFWCQYLRHTPSTAFRHLPPNSARFGYATEGARTLYPRAAVHRRGQRPPKGLGTNQTPSTGLRHSSFWRKVPESGARSVVTNMTVEAT